MESAFTEVILGFLYTACYMVFNMQIDAFEKVFGGKVLRSLQEKGTFHAKMGSIKDRNGMHLTEAEDIKKR